MFVDILIFFFSIIILPGLKLFLQISISHVYIMTFSSVLKFIRVHVAPGFGFKPRILLNILSELLNQFILQFSLVNFGAVFLE